MNKINRIAGYLVLLLAITLLPTNSIAKKDPIKEDQKKIKSLKQNYLKTKRDFLKERKSNKKKNTYSRATLLYAEGIMRSISLKPKQKYPKALKLYREVLKIDPKNKIARVNRDLIIGIYKEMGRKIPS